MRRVLAVLSILLGTLTMGLVSAPATVAGASGPTTVGYDTTVSPNPPTLPSLGYEATQASEVGQQIAFAPGTSRSLADVVVDMDSWACETGSWTSGCTTTPGATFAQPITLNLYNVGPSNTVGSLITSTTQTFAIPYRPTSGGCSDPTAYLASDGSCDHGLLAPVTFTFATPVTVPGTIVYGVAFNTTNYGPDPINGSGGPYDSLNLGLNDSGTGPSVGTDPAGSDSIYWNTQTASDYCDGGAGGVGTFRIDDGLHDGCWSPYEPAVQFNMETACSTTCYVSPTGNDTNSGQADSPFATIQHAVDAVSSGGTVHVAAGTYDENVDITQPVTLDGANVGQPGTGARGAESVISTDNVAGNDYTVEVGSPGVTVDGFTLQQTATVTCSFCAAFGVQVDPTSNGATIADNIITGMSASAPQASRTLNPIGVDISGDNTGDAPNGVTVAHNLIENISSGGTQHVSALGIEVGAASVTAVGSGLQVIGNRITDVTSTSWGSYGIIMDRTTSGSQIVGNTIDTISGGGWAHAIGLEGNAISPVITNNAISGVSSATTDALDIYTDNTNLSAPTATVTDNSLGGVTSGGIASISPGALTATGNWWGCATGPNTTGCSATGGSGTLVLAPWIVSYTPDPAHAGQPGFWPIAVTSSAGPAITSSNTTLFHVGVAGTFTVTATGTPAPSLSVTGTLPAGVSFNPVTGVLSGTPTVPGNSALTVVAHTPGYTDATQSFTLVVSSNTAVISSSASVQGAVGKRINFQVTTIGHPAATITAPGLPSWLGLKPGTGHRAGTATLSGIGPVGGGNFTFTLHANNGIGPDATQTITFHVLAITSVASANFSKSGPPTQTFTITTAGAPAGVTLSATLSPFQAGLTFHDNGNGTATLSGTPTTTARSHVLVVRATSGAYSIIQKLAVGIST